MAGWFETRRDLERRYLSEALTRWSGTEAARRCGLNRSHLYKRLEIIGLRSSSIEPPTPRLSGRWFKWRTFIRREERKYFQALLDCHKVMTHVAAAAELNRTDVYKHLKRVGISPAEIRAAHGLKPYGGNAAWRSLADANFMASVSHDEPRGRVRRLPRPADPGRSTGACRHG